MRSSTARRTARRPGARCRSAATGRRTAPTTSGAVPLRDERGRISALAAGRHALEARQRLLSLAILPGLVVTGAVLDMDMFYTAVLGALLAARAAFAHD